MQSCCFFPIRQLSVIRTVTKVRERIQISRETRHSVRRRGHSRKRTLIGNNATTTTITDLLTFHLVSSIARMERRLANAFLASAEAQNIFWGIHAYAMKDELVIAVMSSALSVIAAKI